MVVSENTLKWLMRLYPPLLLQRIWVVGFGNDFKSVRVKINKSLINRNYNGSIFGGTIFAAADPFLPVLFNQTLNHSGNRKLRIWSKSSKIDFLKPGLGDLFFELKLTDEDIAHAKETLIVLGKYKKVFPIEVFNKDGELCASLYNEIYIRDLGFSKKLL
ncbi:DUF4442 domain-containing protein [Mucilaginibacter sp. ZB1P21]|uniref:DUF4442 domain-containing protein n=1 Tax=Mucilaginibacter glaciei TaxID=2772109 RepID=A0A926NNF7_9SPHI|nr:DUF4442 domain-containing protein [Mucilaginibacter glaciei]